MEELFKSVTKSRDQVEVIYVPDTNVGCIIGLPSNPKKGKSPLKRHHDYRVPKASKVTRSGRKVSSRIKYSSASEVESQDSDSEDALEDVKEDVAKPSELFDEEDVQGKQMFGFHTRGRRKAMVNKATEVIANSPKVLSSPRTPLQSKAEVSTAKTPYSVRKKIKKKLIEEKNRQTIDELLEDSGSEYNPSTDDSEEDKSSGEDSQSSDEDSDVIPLEEAIEKWPKRKDDTPVRTSKSKGRRCVSEYVFTSEDYFDHKFLQIRTSNHTLSKLKNPRLRHDELASLLKSVHPSHQTSLKELHEDNCSLFKRWIFTLREGFNLILYGLGSKRNLINLFHEKYLKHSLVLVVNGFFPGLTLKEILDSLASDLLGLRNIPSQTHEILELLEAKLSASPNRVFLLVHNLDGPSLRSEKIQNTLANLASFQKLHLIASVDHINSSLLWDQSKLSRYNFIWEDATSFLPYTLETSYESSMMIQRSGTLALTSLKNVFQSLTNNTRKVFRIIIDHQLENGGNKSVGMAFPDLYRACRDNFIVSSDLALRTQLTEFLDHQLLKWKKDTDHLFIPVDQNILKQFKEDLDGTDK